MDTHGNYINGQWSSASNGQTYQQYDPADLTKVTGSWPKSTIEDTQNAIKAADSAFTDWSELSVYQRAEYLNRALELLKSRVDQIAKVITLENGKMLSESKGEIQSAIVEMEFQISEGLRMAGKIMPSKQGKVLAYNIRRPLGAVSIIVPWNFPFNVPCRKVTPALISGNTCILKPANLTPGVGAEFIKLFDDAGLPMGVLNFITGSGAVVGEELVVNPAIKAISFTGSTEVGMGIEKKAAANLTRTQLEMGGKNPLVILADADLEAAADAAVLAAFACSGQWCTSTSRVIIEKSVESKVLDMIFQRTKKLVVGKGTDSATTMGPVCGKSQLTNILASIEKGKEEGAKLLLGGKQITSGELDKGCFIEPTVFSNVSSEMHLAQEEIFGPVLSVMTAKDFDDAIRIANSVKFGLSSSIYTSNLKKAMTFIEKSDVGLTHVNIPTAYKEPQLSFGGVKLSGCGIPEGGDTGIEFFTEHKVAYIYYG
jgi:acyl-CoA reductase-like NAD-dependent aldehyde dehydrogenase